MAKLVKQRKPAVPKAPQNRMKRATPTVPAPQAVSAGPAAPGGMNPQLMAALLAKVGGQGEGPDV